MRYIQFFHRGVVSGNLIEACGDRSVIFLDARYRASDQTFIADKECLKRKYLAWEIREAESLLSNHRVLYAGHPKNVGEMCDGY